MTTVDIIVAGAGPAGLASAAALATSGFSVAVVAPRAPARAPDTRTAALFNGSLALLQNIGAWDSLAADTAALAGIRIIDDRDTLLRAPAVTFEAHELGLTAFGANVPQEALARALRDAVERLVNVQFIDAQVTAVDVVTSATRPQPTGHDGYTHVHLDTGMILRAALVVAADGRNSTCRKAANIAAEVTNYPQIAIAAQFGHSREHRGISTEFHRPAGPCTVVPLPGRRSSLVWVERPSIARRLVAADDAAFTAALEERLHGVLGTVTAIGERRHFPLSCVKAHTLAANRVVLVGEAGHTLPPIGAQGLNLGFRDVATLAEIAGVARAAGGDIGGQAVLDRYVAARRTDIDVRTRAVDWLNRSLLADLLPSDLARGASLHLIGGIAALKRQVMRAGFEPAGSLPHLMRPSLERVPVATRRLTPVRDYCLEGGEVSTAGSGWPRPRHCNRRPGPMPPKRSFLRDLQFRVEYALLMLVVAMVRAVPLDTASRLSGRTWQFLGPRLMRRRHLRALDNIAVAFPDMPQAERLRIAMAHWDNLGRVMAETMLMDRILADPSRVVISNERVFARYRDKLGPIVGVSLHMGNWELSVWPLTSSGATPAAVYRSVNNPYVDQYLRYQRRNLYPGGLLGRGKVEGDHGEGQKTARFIMDYVRRGGRLGLVSDLYDRNGLPVPFFGRDARTVAMPAMIARRVGARIWMARTVRQGDAARFLVDMVELRVPRTANQGEDIRWATAAMQRQFEAWVRETPDQWMWSNRRWS